MSDRRTLWSNGRVAHVSLRGKTQADQFVQGVDHVVTSTPVAALRDAPFGKIDRQLLTGERFCVLDTRTGWSFGFARNSGYAGYVESRMLWEGAAEATHVVSNRMTMALDKPDFKARTQETLLSLGSPVAVEEDDGTWQRITSLHRDMFIPSAHSRPISQPESDPVTVAERLLGTPYVWGGNSALGIDCSGLVQIARNACGLLCPGDSDLQMAAFAPSPQQGPPYQRGDLLFWKGHVAWVADPETIIHANAHHMAVAYEPLDQAIARIDRQGDGPVLRHTSGLQ